MVKYTIQRLVLAIVTAFVILTLTFFLIKQLPFQPSGGTQAQAIAWWEQQASYGNAYMFYELHPELGEPLAHFQFNAGKKNEYWEYFYGAPAYEQYFAWLRNVFQGKWGASQSIEIDMSSHFGLIILLWMYILIIHYSNNKQLFIHIVNA